jgi:hypothetical protein
LQLVLVVSVSWFFAVFALWRRRFGPVVVSAALLFVAYVTRVFGDVEVELFWQSALFGAGLFVMLELGHDCTSVSHGRLTPRTYRLRGRFIAVVALIDLAVVFAVATLAYNAAVRFPELPLAALVVPALFVSMGGAALLTYLNVKRRRGSDDERGARR